MEGVAAGAFSTVIGLENLKPYLAITILECVSDDVAGAFAALHAQLRVMAADPGRSLSVSITGDRLYDATAGGPDREILLTGLDYVSVLTRRRDHRPSWVTADTPLADLSNELTVAMQKDRLVAVNTYTRADLLRWADDPSTPYRRIPPSVMSGTFEGNGKTLWLKGVHRRRSTKPDSKVLVGPRLQDALDPSQDSTFALSAMTLEFEPEDEAAVLKGNLTVTPVKSRLAVKSFASVSLYISAVLEALAMLEKALASDSRVVAFPELAVPEKDLENVRGAFDLRVADPDELRGDPAFDDCDLSNADLLRSSILTLTGDSTSNRAVIEVGSEGSVHGQLSLRAVGTGDNCHLAVGYVGTPRGQDLTERVRAVLGEGELLSVYYESGHAFNGRTVSRQNFDYPAFTRIEFEDFSGFQIVKEKPGVRGDQRIHDSIAKNGDDSLFAWVAKRYSEDWLVCDDGSGEIADFLHLDGEGTLTAIHVKAAHTASVNRNIALTPFEQVVSQAEKNVRLLKNDDLIVRLKNARIERPACWLDGDRLTDRSEFIEMLGARDLRNKTRIVIVQPHLLKRVYDRARASAARGSPDRDSRSLALLDDLLFTTRRTVVGIWDDILVVGSS